MNKNNDSSVDYETLLSLTLLKVRQYRNKKGLNSTVMSFALLFLIPACIGLALDLFASYSAVFNYIRAFMVLVMIFALSTLGYLLSEEYVSVKKTVDRSYQSVREKTALRMRRYFAVIVCVLAGTIILVTSREGQSTVLVAVMMSSALLSFVFARSTEKERKRLALGLPDPRERNYDVRMEQLQQERAVKDKLKHDKKANRKKLFTRGIK